MDSPVRLFGANVFASNCETYGYDESVATSAEPISHNWSRYDSVAANFRLEKLKIDVTPRRVAETEVAKYIYRHATQLPITII